MENEFPLPSERIGQLVSIFQTCRVPHILPEAPTLEAMSTAGITVTQAQPSQYQHVVEVLVDAFAQDPGFLRLIPQPDPEDTMLRGLFELQIRKQYSEFGRIDVALNEQGEIVGVALWDSPDGSHSAKDHVVLLPQMIKLFGVQTAKLVLKEFSSARLHPKFPHWYLYTIASVPPARGTGVGSALLNHGIERAGDEAIYLEATSTRSAQLYHRLGFVPLGYIPDQDDMPSELAMWKPPTMPRAEG